MLADERVLANVAEHLDFLTTVRLQMTCRALRSSQFVGKFEKERLVCRMSVKLLGDLGDFFLLNHRLETIVRWDRFDDKDGTAFRARMKGYPFDQIVTLWFDIPTRQIDAILYVGKGPGRCHNSMHVDYFWFSFKPETEDAGKLVNSGQLAGPPPSHTTKILPIVTAAFNSATE